LNKSNQKQLYEELIITQELIDRVELVSEATVPEYIQKLINAGHLFPDGKRVVNNLTNVAKYLEADCKVAVSERLLEEIFLQPNGKKYSSSACKTAMSNIRIK